MAANQAIIRAMSAAVLRPALVDSDGNISGVGDAIELDYIQGQKFSIAKSGTGVAAEATSDEKINVTNGNGVTVQYNKVTKTIDKDGNVVASTSSSGGGGGGAGDVVGFTAFQVRKADVKIIHEYADNPWVLGVQIGQNADSAEDMTVYLLGAMNNTPEFGAAPETATQWSFEVTGGKAYSLDGTFLAAGLAWAPGAITPVGEDDAVTLTPLLEADVAATTYAGSGAAKGLLSGRAVIY